MNLLFAILLSLPSFAGVHFPRGYCAWSPRHPEICAARAACHPNPRNRVCARYCVVNPYDVICGEVYHQPYQASPPSYGDSPYPWARSGGGFCAQNPGHIACQNDAFIDWND